MRHNTVLHYDCGCGHGHGGHSCDTDCKHPTTFNCVKYVGNDLDNIALMEGDSLKTFVKTLDKIILDVKNRIKNSTVHSSVGGGIDVYKGQNEDDIHEFKSILSSDSVLAETTDDEIKFKVSEEWLSKKLQPLKDKDEELDNKIDSVNEKILEKVTKINTNISDIGEQVATNSTKIAENATKASENGHDIDKLESRMDDVEEKAEGNETEISNLKVKDSDLEDLISDLTDKVDTNKNDCNSEIVELKNKLAENSTKIQSNKECCDNNSEDLESLETKVSVVENKVTSNTEKITVLKEKDVEILNKIVEVSNNVSGNAQIVDDLKQELLNKISEVFGNVEYVVEYEVKGQNIVQLPVDRDKMLGVLQVSYCGVVLPKDSYVVENGNQIAMKVENHGLSISGGEVIKVLYKYKK